jgi:hypothetical protein
MRINLKQYNIGVDRLMAIAGYKKYNQGWIRQVGESRFHALREGCSMLFHVDIYTDTNTHEHFSIPMPTELEEERVRIHSRLLKNNLVREKYEIN